MKNEIVIDVPIISQNRIDYKYEISGEWKEAFKLEKNFFIEYSYDISNIPEGIAIIPFICNILPIAWIYDAEIKIQYCDEDFLYSIDEFKKGYIEMYPKLEFKGKVTVENIQKNIIENSNGALAFFSGGVDAFNTLLNHINEKPTLLTVWGADIKLSDDEGWNNVLNHVNQTSHYFETDYIIIKSNLRECFDEGILTNKVKNAKEDWWHGFQHGIGIISHAAPIAYAMNKTKIYFASSFTIADKGNITCASDPTIDNYLKISNARVIHDGYEFTRQNKVRNIVEYCKKNNKKLKLRVCWQESRGENCCECEKCWRTILEIIAENAQPSEYGLHYTNKQLKDFHKIYYNSYIADYRRTGYLETQNRMKEILEYDKLPKEIKYFYNTKIDKFLYHPIYKFYKKVKNKIGKIYRKVKG